MELYIKKQKRGHYYKPGKYGGSINLSEILTEVRSAQYSTVRIECVKTKTDITKPTLLRALALEVSDKVTSRVVSVEDLITELRGDLC